MFKRVFLLAAFISVAGLQEVWAQSAERKFEAGGQFSLLSVTQRTEVVGIIDCFPTPCPNPNFSEVSQKRVTIAGVGGRFGYNFSDHFALEAESNFFPADREFEGGRKIQAVFGVKAGKRLEKVGLFGKARPGFVRYQKGAYRPNPGPGCITLFPEPAACFLPLARTNFAFDLGGVVELYPGKNTIIRFDAGDTIIRLPEGIAVVNSIFPVVEPVPAKTTHNFQTSVGVGFRF